MRLAAGMGHLKTIGGHIRARRLVLGLFQKEAARKLGVDPSTLARWKQGKHKPIRRLLESVKAFASAAGGNS